MWIISIHDRFHIQTLIKRPQHNLDSFFYQVCIAVFLFYPEYIIKVLSDGYVFIVSFFSNGFQMMIISPVL